MRVPVELRRSYKLVNHGPTVLVSASHAGRSNVMAAAWTMPLDTDPARMALVLSSDSYTRSLVEESGELAINVPTRAMAAQVLAAGRCTGREVDKFAAFGLQTMRAGVVGAPLVEGCVAWLECRLLPEPAMRERYDLVLCEVVAAWADDSAFVDGSWRFADDAQRTIHHVTNGVFLAAGERVQAEAAEPRAPLAAVAGR